MRAVTVVPGERRLALADVPEPAAPGPSEVALRVLDVGICGTDREIAAFDYGTPPAGEDFLVIGHESLLEVVSVGSEVGDLTAGDLVVPRVRRPCSVPTCGPCRTDRPDYCRTGAYREHGIARLHGFMTEQVVQDRHWLQPVPRGLRDVGVLVEPLTIAEKGLAQVRAVAARVPGEPADPLGAGRTAVVLGAGPVGLLGAMALLAEGFTTYVYSRSPAPNDRSELAERIGAPYISSKEVDVDGLVERTGPVDVIYEAAGVATAAFELMKAVGTNGVFIFTGVARSDPPSTVDIAALNRQFVLKNQVILGTVNAGAADFAAAVAHLEVFRDRWGDTVDALITGRHPLEEYDALLTGPARGIKDTFRVAE